MDMTGRIARLGPEQRMRIRRDRDRDLEIQGWELGRGSLGFGPKGTAVGDPDYRQTDVRIYLTVGGSWVAAIDRTGGGRDRHEATVHDTAEEAFRWLTRDGIGQATKDAWERARERWPELPAIEVERID